MREIQRKVPKSKLEQNYFRSKPAIIALVIMKKFCKEVRLLIITKRLGT